MRRPLLALAVLLAMTAPAHAVITQQVVIILGVQLTPDQAKASFAKQAALEKAGIRLVGDPSMTVGLAAPPGTTYAGRVLATRTIERNRPTGALAATPTDAEIDALKKLLAANGLPTDVQVIAFVLWSGGK